MNSSPFYEKLSKRFHLNLKRWDTALEEVVVEVVAVTGEVEEVDQEEAILVLTTLPWEQVRTRMAVVATAAVVDGKPSVLALKV